MANPSSEPDFQNAATRWAVTWKLVQELWPGWEASDDQHRIWERSLGRRYQVDVRNAVEQVFAEKASTWPRLGWVLAVLKGRTPHHGSAERYEFSDSEIAEVVGDDQDMVDDLMELPPEYLRELLVEGLTASFMLDRKIATVGPATIHLRHQAQKAAKDFHLEVRRWDSELRGLVWAAWQKATGRASVPPQGPLRQETPQDTTVQETAPAGSQELWRDISDGGRTI